MEKREHYSKKRMAILNTLRETDSHPTADWVYERLKPEYPDLSLGTVYRNLKFLCDSGRAISVGVINGQEHFDGFTVPHSHFTCQQCGAVLDVPKEFFGPGELRQLSRNTGHEVASASVMFHGVCRQCLEKEEEPAIQQ